MKNYLSTLTSKEIIGYDKKQVLEIYDYFCSLKYKAMNNLTLIPIDRWFSNLTSRQLIISGPCAAESHKQIITTAKALSKISMVKVFRTGLWKPRTRPGSFEGVGIEGLRWLNEVKQKTGLHIAVEIATAEHVDLALKHNIDMIWLGARTTSNPFAVQAIADSLKGFDIPVLVKNPVNPDLELWIGAIERIYNAGIRKLAAVHRGFYPFEKTKLRNIPQWEVPIELKTRFNELPIINDPSHIAGNINYIQDISQKALDLNMDGLMIESHINPDKALSDSQQQLHPDELNKLVKKLIFRSIQSQNDKFQSTIDSLREKIDSIDKKIIDLLANRMELAEKIGNHKHKNKVTIFQLRRWEEIIASRLAQATEKGLSEKFVKSLLQLVHEESIRKQTEIMGNRDDSSNDEPN
ncbi:MAG: chorismate mutase [Bacteroidales bacterium]